MTMTTVKIDRSISDSYLLTNENRTSPSEIVRLAMKIAENPTDLSTVAVYAEAISNAVRNERKINDHEKCIAMVMEIVKRDIPVGGSFTVGQAAKELNTTIPILKVACRRLCEQGILINEGIQKVYIDGGCCTHRLMTFTRIS